MASTLSAPVPRSLREENASEMRELLLATAVALIERGEEPTMRAVAREARVGERTVYRYFESREVLHEALIPRFVGRAGVHLCDRFDELENYADALFTTFSDNRALNVALLTSAWAASTMSGSRSKNLKDLRKLIDGAFPQAPSDERAAAAATMRTVLSGSGWLYLCVSCGLSKKDAVSHVRWLIRTAAERLKRASKKH